jgi:hypothetical protein
MKTGSILLPSITGNQHAVVVHLRMLSVCMNALRDGMVMLSTKKRSAVDGLKAMRGCRRSM